MRDRNVHATLPNGAQIVRYYRAGKWYVEYAPHTLKPRRAITLAKAVEMASTPGSYVYLGKTGGKAFDAAVKAAA